MILATKNDAIWLDIAVTPDIEGGIGPVEIGERLVLTDGVDIWYIVVHPFGEIDQEWITAYTTGENPPIEVWAEIPSNLMPLNPPTE